MWKIGFDYVSAVSPGKFCVFCCKTNFLVYLVFLADKQAKPH